MHSSRSSSSSNPTRRSISAHETNEISTASGREATAALEPLQEIARIASFHSPRHLESKGSLQNQEHESLRSDMPNMTASSTSSHSGRSAYMRNGDEGLQSEPRRQQNRSEPSVQSTPDDLIIPSPDMEEGGLKILMQPPTPHREPSPVASSSGGGQPPWKSPPVKSSASRSRSPKDSSSYPRDARSYSPQTGTPVHSGSTTAQTLTTEFTLQIGSYPPKRSESPIPPPSPTSQTTPPRSPVVSPRPRNLLLGSISPVRDRSPARRVDSPLAQSISPQPGFIAESGNGILSPRLSPNPSPMASPGTEIPNPLSPRSLSRNLLARVDQMEYSADVFNNGGEVDYFNVGSSESTPTGSSPLPSTDIQSGSEPTLVDSPAIAGPSDQEQGDEDQDYVMLENEAGMDEDQQQAMFLDDEGLTALEKIYLFSRSTFSFHRSYISKQLPFLIRDVPPTEAVDYVCPLLNGLGTDPEESVKEVFVQELVPIIWWFFTQCQLYDHQQPEPPPVDGVTFLPADAFTPLIGSLLLSANPRVGDGARLAIVDLINRLQVPETISVDDRFCEPSPSVTFGDAEKTIIMNEIMNGVVLGMGRLDSEFQEGGAVQDADAAYGNREGPRSGAPSPEDMAAAFDNKAEQSSSSSPEQFIYSPQANENTSQPFRPKLKADDQGFDGDFGYTPHQNGDDDGWISSMPQTPDEQLAQLGSTLESQELGTIEEEPAANDTGDEATVGRVASMSVVAAIAANATMPLNMQEVFVQEVWRVGSDSVYWVRREASFAIGALAKVVPIEMVEIYLLPLYKALVEDEQWHVRHSILFALPGILARVDAAQRRSLTVPSLVHLSRDPSDPVRSGLLEVLGEVIYTFRDDPNGPPLELLQLFIQDCDWSEEDPRLSPAPSNPFLSHVDWFSDPERPIICAFNFPAVILTVGARRWSEVRKYYLHLAKFPTAKVLRTLAASLGEVATIIGSANAEADLIPIFQSSLRSNEPEVRSKIIEALPKFVGTLSEPKRESIIAELSEVWLELGGWREREELAHLLGQLVSLSGKRVGSVIDIMSKALRDEVAAVREAAISSVPAYLKALRGSPAHEPAMEDILNLSVNDKYRQRVTFVACALSMSLAAQNPAELEALTIWNSVAMLAQDPIVDIRIGVARLVANSIERLYPKRRRRWKLMTTLLGLLGTDEEPQVRSFVSFLMDNTDLSTPQGSSYNESGFAIFSKPPRSTDHRPIDKKPSIENQIDAITAAVADKMDLDQPKLSVPTVTTSEPPGDTSSSTQGPTVVPSSPSKTVGSGTSRGEESQASPRPNEDDSPRQRSGKSRRKNLMTLSDLPQGIELTEAYQAGLLNAARLTPSPGSERRISFDALSSHSDGSDSSGRMDTIPLPRRRSLHRMPSDVSVASG